MRCPCLRIGYRPRVLSFAGEVADGVIILAGISADAIQNALGHVASRPQASGVSVPEPRAVTGIYPDLSHAEDWDLAIRETAWVPDAVPEDWCAKYCIMGTAARRLRRSGWSPIASRISTSGGSTPVSWPAALCETFSGEVLPLCRR